MEKEPGIITAAKQFSELAKIGDLEERIKTACKKFSDGEISAKTVRMLYGIVNDSQKIEMLDLLYEKSVRAKNMERLPPSIFAQKSVFLNEKDDIELYGKIAGYHLIHIYETSKVQDKCDRFYKAILRYKGNSIIKTNNKSHIDQYAIGHFIDDFINSEKIYDISRLDLPQLMTIGMEIEFVGIEQHQFDKVQSLLISYGFYIGTSFKETLDVSMKKKNKTGIELASPIIYNEGPEQWMELARLCSFIKILGGTTNNTCGGHIHIGANILGVDKAAWEYFLKIWTEIEPIMYVISNRKGEKTRPSISDYGRPIEERISQIDWRTIRIESEQDLKSIASKIYGSQYNHAPWLSEGFYRTRYLAVNLENVGDERKNTIEFRIPNGTVEYDIWRENILLLGKIIQTAKLCSIDLSLKKDKLERFFEKDLPEEEKVRRFLDLIFNDEKDKEIFYKRWESKAGDTPVFGKETVKTYKKHPKHLPREKRISPYVVQNGSKENVLNADLAGKLSGTPDIADEEK